jgi:hypothetical protein
LTSFLKASPSGATVSQSPGSVRVTTAGAAPSATFSTNGVQSTAQNVRTMFVRDFADHSEILSRFGATTGS